MTVPGHPVPPLPECLLDLQPLEADNRISQISLQPVPTGIQAPPVRCATAETRLGPEPGGRGQPASSELGVGGRLLQGGRMLPLESASDSEFCKPPNEW